MEPVEVGVVEFESGDGTRLVGDLLSPAASVGNAVVCHPHPLYGGNRHDAVVAALSRALVGAGQRVLRFDFRGAGDSEGQHADGDGERDDLLGALAFLGPEPVIIAGYSFGADIALSVATPATQRWLAVAPPLAVFGIERFVARGDDRPVDVIAAEHDQFNSPDALAATIADWTAATVHVVDGADHFFGGAHTRVAALSERIAAP